MQPVKNIISFYSSLITVLFAMMVFPSLVNSQPVVNIGDYTGCSNTEMLIPVEIKNMTDIAAITLFIKVDTADVDFMGVENVNDVFSSGDFVSNADTANQQIVLTWFSLTPATIDSGMICNLRVLLKGGSFNFEFRDNCEFAKSDLTIVENVEYSNGSLTTLSSYIPDPVTQSIIEGNTATIELHDLPQGLSLQWQKKVDENWIDISNDATFNGVTDAKLSIFNAPASMNESRFRCMIANGVCSEGTVESELFVTPNGIDDKHDQNYLSPLTTYPNPAQTALNCVVNTDIYSGKLSLVNANGVIVDEQQITNLFAGEVLTFNLFKIESGIYFVKLFKLNKMIASVKVLRN